MMYIVRCKKFPPYDLILQLILYGRPSGITMTKKTYDNTNQLFDK